MTFPSGLGSIIAVVVLCVAVVLIVVGTLPLITGGLIAALAVARLT